MDKTIDPDMDVMSEMVARAMARFLAKQAALDSKGKLWVFWHDEPASKRKLH
jgi:hypothetical protein